MNKILILGCGSIGQRHIKALLKIGETNIVAYRTNRGQIKEIDEAIKANIKIFNDEEESFVWKPTHVIISNPTILHLKYLIKSITIGARVFVEKPLTNSYSEFEEASIPLTKIADYGGVVGFNLRFHSLIKKVKEVITSFQYGNVIYANLTVGHYLPFWHPYENYRYSYASRKDLGGGVLRTLCHEIDLAQFFFGKINKVFAKVEKISPLEIDIDDVVDLIVETQMCKRVLIHMDYLNPIPIRQGKILFDKGLLEYDYNNNEIFFTDYINKHKELLFTNNEDYDQQYIAQMENFINGNTDTACTIREGIEVMKVIYSCEESNRMARQVCI